jgi:enoyl-CoA hydratase/carnithine racemase
MELVRAGLNSDKLLRDVMYNGDRYTFAQGKELGFVDEIVPEAELIAAAKKKLTYWWDQPGHAFSNIKYCLKYPIASHLRHRLDNENWQDKLVETLTSPLLKGIFDMVQKVMTGAK